jgi:hypothetical protein
MCVPEGSGRQEQPRREAARSRFPLDARFVLVDAQVVGRREFEGCSSNQKALAVGTEDLASIGERQMGESVPEERRS